MPRGIYVRSPEDLATIGRLRARALVEQPDRCHEGSHRGGTTATRLVWRCDTCGREVRGPSIAHHQRASSHSGKTLVRVVGS